MPPRPAARDVTARPTLGTRGGAWLKPGEAEARQGPIRSLGTEATATLIRPSPSGHTRVRRLRARGGAGLGSGLAQGRTRRPRHARVLHAPRDPGGAVKTLLKASSLKAWFIYPRHSTSRLILCRPSFAFSLFSSSDFSMFFFCFVRCCFWQVEKPRHACGASC